jgi:hypothetical protein
MGDGAAARQQWVARVWQATGDGESAAALTVLRALEACGGGRAMSPSVAVEPYGAGEGRQGKCGDDSNRTDLLSQVAALGRDQARVWWWPAPQETDVRFDHTDIVATALPVGRHVSRDTADARPRYSRGWNWSRPGTPTISTKESGSYSDR